MQPIRQVINDAPDFFPIPPELRHRKVEIILWPLDEGMGPPDLQVKPPFRIAQVEEIDIPSREQRNERR